MKKIAIPLILCLVSVLIASGCDSLYRLLDKEGAEEKELVGEATIYEPNMTVEEIQSLLSLYGYDPGKADGVLGLRTRNAIERFQRDNGLEPSRFVDNRTWEKLNVFKKNHLVVKGEINAALVQELLTRAGFSPGPADGKMGPKTKNAVKQFQKKFGLKADGKIGYKTLTALAAFLHEEESSGAAAP